MVVSKTWHIMDLILEFRDFCDDLWNQKFRMRIKKHEIYFWKHLFLSWPTYTYLFMNWKLTPISLVEAAVKKYCYLLYYTKSYFSCILFIQQCFNIYSKCIYIRELSRNSLNCNLLSHQIEKCGLKKYMK